MSQKLSKQALKHKKQVTQEWIQKKCDTETTYRELRAIRALLSQTFRRHLNGHTPKSRRLETITGISTSLLMSAILSTAPEGFTASTYGSEYEIDHIQPIATFQTIQNPVAALGAAFSASNLRIVRKNQNRPGRHAGRKN